MRIAIFSDSHIGVKRFYEDAKRQFLLALEEIKRHKPDVVLHAGDLFDTWKVQLNDLKFAIDAFRSFVDDTGIKPIIIAGNHDTTTRDVVRGVDILHSSGVVVTLRAGIEESDVRVMGLSYVPPEDAYRSLKYLTDKYGKADILLMHEDIAEITRQGPSIKQLRGLGHGLIVNGHIHKKHLLGNFVIPGSTVATKINLDELDERGIVIWEDGEATFFPIPSRKIILEELDVTGLSLSEIESKLQEIYAKNNEKYDNPYIKIKLTGALAEGISKADIKIPKVSNLEIDKSQLISSTSSLIRTLRDSVFEGKSVVERADDLIINGLRGTLSLLPADFYKVLKESEKREELEEWLESFLNKESFRSLERNGKVES